jgi:hypothetical protein
MSLYLYKDNLKLSEGELSNKYRMYNGIRRSHQFRMIGGTKPSRE